MCLEQFAKLRQFQYQTYMNNNTKLSIKNTMHVKLKSWMELALNWSKKIIKT